MTDPHADGGLECPTTRSALVTPQAKVTLFVHRASQQWVVLDPEGNFWLLTNAENPWDERQPFYPTEENELEPVPGHYKYMLDLPF